jgi:CRP-like cAMP-binding protein
MTPIKTKLWYLKNIDILNHLSEEEIRMIDQYSTMREIKKGEALYLQGSADKNIYILKKGAVKITRLTPQGREIILDIFKGGSIFGEMAIAEPQERNESAEMLEDGLICIVKKEDLDQLIQRMPSLSIQITKMMGSRRCRIENKLLDLLFSTVEQRLAKILLNLLEDFGIPDDDRYLLKIKLTHKDYAALTASTRETVTATFNKLRNGGLIDFMGKYVVIKSLAGLRRISG